MGQLAIKRRRNGGRSGQLPPRVDNNDQRDRNFNGIGDACETPGLFNTTAAFMQAGFNGSTFVEPRSLLHPLKNRVCSNS